MAWKKGSKELTPQICLWICELKSIGWGAKRIHNKHPEILLSTIKSTIQLEAIPNDNKTCSRSGRPHKISEEQRDLIYGLTESDPHIKIRDLADAVDEVVKKQSI